MNPHPTQTLCGGRLIRKQAICSPNDAIPFQGGIGAVVVSPRLLFFAGDPHPGTEPGLAAQLQHGGGADGLLCGLDYGLQPRLHQFDCLG